MMKLKYYLFSMLIATSLKVVAKETETNEKLGSITVTHSKLEGIGDEKGVMRRDPSDVIKVGDTFYVWYSKGDIFPGYDSTVWYATSKDGHKWVEKGEAVARGEAGTWESASVFTPNILAAEGKYYLFYTGTTQVFAKKPFNPDSKIGLAISDSPDGPWKKIEGNPVITNSKNNDDFDSHLIDDACLIVRDGKYWCYYKGGQQGKGPGQTQMGVAIAEKPEGPYIKHESNPVIPGNHEVLVWAHGKGVAAMIGTTGPKEITKSVLYAEDSLNFKKIDSVKKGPWAGGAYRPESFTESGKGTYPAWGVEIAMEGSKSASQKRAKGHSLPCIGRWDAVATPAAVAEEVKKAEDKPAK